MEERIISRKFHVDFLTELTILVQKKIWPGFSSVWWNEHANLIRPHKVFNPIEIILESEIFKITAVQTTVQITAV